MSRVSNCNTSNFSQIDEYAAPASLPAQPPAAAGAQEAGGPAPGDTWEPASSGTIQPPLAGAERPRASGAAMQLPEPPRSPRELGTTIPPAGLEGPELERAQLHNAACWNDYAERYRAYVEECRAAIGGCRSLGQLRRLDPEPPDDAMAMVGYERQYEGLDRELRGLYGAKVDRGYALLGEASPGTLLLMLKGSVKLLGAGAEFGVTLDDDGAAQTRSRASLDSQVLKLEVDQRGRADVRLGAELDGWGLKASGRAAEFKAPALGGLDRVGARVDFESRRLTLGGEVVPGVGVRTTYDARSAVYGGGVTVGRSLKTASGLALAEAKAEAQLLFKGMSREDVRRVLDGWLVPDRYRGGAAAR